MKHIFKMWWNDVSSWPFFISGHWSKISSVVLLIRDQDSQWFRSCLSITLSVCQVISQPLRLEFIDTHLSIPPTLHPSPSIRPLCIVSPLVALPSRFFSHPSRYATIYHNSIRTSASIASSFIFARVWAAIYLFSSLPELFLHPLFPLNVLTTVI